MLDGGAPAVSVPWAPALGLSLSLRLDGLALLFVLLILGIGLLVVAYARWYLGPEERHAILAAAALALPGGPLAVGLKAMLVIVLLFITAPIAAHMLARAARAGGIRPAPETHTDELSRATIERAGEGPAGR